MDTKIYTYKMKAIPLVAAIAFGIFFILWGALIAVNYLLGTMKMDGTLATAWEGLYGGLAIMAGVAVVIFGFKGLTKGRDGTAQAMLNATGLVASKSALSSVIVEIPFQDILKVTVHKYKGQRSVIVQGKSDKVAIREATLQSEI